MSEPRQNGLQTTARKLWPHLRVLMVFLHLFAIFVLALPSSHRLTSRSHWNKPKQKADMKRWADTLGVEAKELDAFLWKWTQRYAVSLRWVGRPFLKYADYAGTRQHWTMFSSPRRRTGRYEIEIEVDGQFERIFRTKDDEAEWNRWAFEHNRMRKLLAKLTTHPQMKAFEEFTGWVAGQVAKDFPEAQRCRITLYTWKLLEAHEVREDVQPKVAKSRTQILELEEYR